MIVMAVVATIVIPANGKSMRLLDKTRALNQGNDSGRKMASAIDLLGQEVGNYLQITFIH